MKKLLPLLFCFPLLLLAGAQSPMQYAPFMMKKAAASSFTAYATTFGGTSEYMTYNTSTLTQTKSVTLSIWFKLNADNNNQTLICWRNGGSGLRRNSDNTLSFFVRSTTHNPGWAWVSTTQYKVADGWIHFAASFHSDSTSTRSVYINGSAQSDARWTTYNVGDTTLTTDIPTLHVGCNESAGNKVNGCLSEIWLASQYTDLSSTIGSFYSGGHPVDLGSGGATPTGTQPEYYFKNPYTSFNVNAGSLSATLTVNGSLSSCTAP